jgi:hypothetical protein
MRIKSFHEFENGSEINEKGTMVPLGPSLESSEFKNLKMGDAPARDLINKPLLQDVEAAARAAKVHVLITAANSDHDIHRSFSRHTHGTAGDYAIIADESVPFSVLMKATKDPNSPYRGSGCTKQNPNLKPKFREAGNRLVDGLISLGYVLMTQDPTLRSKYPNSLASGESGHSKTIIWQYDAPKAGNHYNHVHISCEEAYASAGTPNVGSDVAVNQSGSKIKIDSDQAKRDALSAKLDPKSPLGQSANDYYNEFTGETGAGARIGNFGIALVKGLKDTMGLIGGG